MNLIPASALSCRPTPPEPRPRRSGARRFLSPLPWLVALGLSTVASGLARQETPLGTTGWALWLDRTAVWKTDDLYVPPVAISSLPVHPPTGGWAGLFSQVVPEAQVTSAVGTASANSANSLSVSVPGTVEQYFWNTLSGSSNGHGTSGDYVGVSWWGKDFSVPTLSAGQRVKLVFTEGVRQRAEIFVNQQLVGYEMVHQTPFEVDITSAVVAGGANKLAVRITDPGGNFGWGDSPAQIWGTNGTAASPSGYLYPMSHGFGGILGAVNLRIVTPVHVNDVFVKNKPTLTDVDADIELANETGAAATGTISVSIIEAWKHNAAVASPQTVYTASAGSYSVPANGTATVSTSASVPAALLWAVRDGNLYNFLVTVKDSGGNVIDQYVQRFGFRFLSVQGYGTNTQLFLNGQRTFILSAISWGFWPENGIFPTAALARKHITSAQTLGLNMLNFHRCEGNSLVLNAADELGMLYYEEPGGYSSGQIADTDPLRQTLKNFTVDAQLTTQRVLRLVRRDRSHPSLIQYNMINEPGGLPTQQTKDDMAAMHLADPTRTISYGSGGMSPGITQAQKLHVIPNDQTQRTIGYCDMHNASASPGVYVDAMYGSPTSFLRSDKDPTEIFVWGEEGAIATPPQLETIQGNITAAGRGGWDGSDYNEWYNAYATYISSKGLSAYYPSITNLITSLGSVGYYEHGRLIENVRIADDADMYVLNGYEDMKLDNISGIVDIYRNIKGDPTLLSQYMQPLVMAVKARGKIAQVGETNLADFYVLNEHEVAAGSYPVTITVEKPDGTTQTLLTTNAAVSGGNKMSDPVAQGVSVPLNGGPGYYIVKATLTAAGQTVVGHDEILAVDWQSDQIGGQGAVLSGDSQLYSFIHDVKGANVVPYTSGLGRLDYVVVGAIDQGTTFNTVPSSNFRALDGTTTGLNVDLYRGSAGTAFTTLVDQRVSAAPIDFDSSSHFIPGWDLVGPVDFSVRMQGTITSSYTGTTQFQVPHDDGVRIWINGTQVLNAWTNGSVRTDTFSYDMVAGQAYTIKIEAYQAGSQWRLALQWKLPVPPITVDYAGLLNRVAQDGTKLLLVDKAETWLTSLAAAIPGAIPSYSVFHPLKTWVGSNMFVRDHLFFQGLPVNRGMGWEYQSLVVYDGPTHFGLYNMSGEEPVVSLVGGASHLVSTSVGILTYGAGKIVFSSLDLVNNLALTTKASNVPRKILCNYLKWASGVTGAPLNRAGWLYSASPSSTTAQNAGDGSLSTRWTSGASTATGQWFQVDLGATRAFDQVVMDQGTSTNDYPAGYQVYVSNDGVSWGSAVASGVGTPGMTTANFPQQTARYIRVLRTGAVGTYWSIHEFRVYGAAFTPTLLSRTGWAYSASASSGGNPPANAGDGSLTTSWGTGVAQANSQWFQIDLGTINSVGQLLLDSGATSNDYPRAWQVKVSNDGTNWGNAVTSGTGAIGVNTINLAPQTVRYLRVYQTGTAASNWWSINEINAVGTPVVAVSRSGWVASASLTQSGTTAANAIDASATTRWSSGVGQAAGQWFQVDMGSARTFNQVVLDAASSVSDYPRGYEVYVSNDGVNWGTAITSGASLSAIATIPFPPQVARYFRIVQTGSTANFWTIYDLNVYGPVATIPAAPTGLTAIGGNSQVNLSWTASAGAASYTVQRAATSSGPYTTVASNVTGTSYTDATAGNGISYYYVVSATNGAGASGNSTAASGTAAPLPSPWQRADVGTVGVAGNAFYVSPTYTVIGSGADISGSADGFRYAYQTSSGDCSIVARVVSQQIPTSGWAKAGVMLRESTAAGAMNAALVVSNGALNFQWRSATGGATSSTGGGALPPPNAWVKLTRVGNVVSAYKSTDGSTWTQVGTTQTLTMAASATIGLPVTSHDNTVTSTATFDNVTVAP